MQKVLGLLLLQLCISSGFEKSKKSWIDANESPLVIKKQTSTNQQSSQRKIREENNFALTTENKENLIPNNYPKQRMVDWAPEACNPTTSLFEEQLYQRQMKRLQILISDSKIFETRRWKVVIEILGCHCA